MTHRSSRATKASAAGELTTTWIWPPRVSQLAARAASTGESASSQAAKQPTMAADEPPDGADSLCLTSPHRRLKPDRPGAQLSASPIWLIMPWSSAADRRKPASSSAGQRVGALDPTGRFRSRSSSSLPLRTCCGLRRLNLGLLGLNSLAFS